MTSSTFGNMAPYIDLRDFLINCEGYTFKQLFGLKYPQLMDLYYGKASTIYAVTKSKRAWLRAHIDTISGFFGELF
jgi:hypothetical protein